MIPLGPTKSPSPSFNQPSLAMVTFPNGPILREENKNFVTPKILPADSEADLTSSLSPKDDFEILFRTFLPPKHWRKLCLATLMILFPQL